MPATPRFAALAVAVSVLPVAAFAQAQAGTPAPLLDGMGSHRFPVSTESQLAQRYIDQGLILSYGFNNQEAHRSLMYATKLDPECAMAFWGAAMVLGPNLNSGMSRANGRKAAGLVEEALARLDNATPREQALIRALKFRYSSDGDASRSELDRAYADAMRTVAEQYPNDDDVLTWTAEALMDVHKWNYWNSDGTPKEWTPEITDMLARALEINAYNPGANHFTIHAWEGSKTPDVATPAADRLLGLVPGISHLQHMPSHIYLLTGRYHEGCSANIGATEAYIEYAKLCRDIGLKPIGGYKAHNWDYLWHCARWEGRRELAMKAARMLASFVKLGARSQRQHALPMYTQIQFSRWDQILATPQPSDEHAYLQFVWRYGRAMAHLREGDVEASNADLDEMRRLAVSDGVRKSRVRQVNGMTEIAIGMVKGEIAAATGDYDAAIEALAVARGIEDGLSYHETRTWPHPVQITLGRILADAGRIDEAEAALLENLSESPENGWALFQLSRVYRLQGKGSEADAVLARYEAAWEFADRTVLEGG